MLKFLLIVSIFAFSINNLIARDSSVRPPRVGIEQTERRFLKSKIINEEYEIDVWLPRNYYDLGNYKKYPVIYLTDSELNFPIVSFIMRRLIKNKDIPPAILVGISHNTSYKDWYYIKRARDLTPTKWKHKKFPKTGESEKFARFLKEEVFSFITKTYRTDEKDRTLIGMSFGGLFGHYVMFNFPTLFKRFLIVSPSIWFGQKYLIQEEERFSKKNKRLDAIVYTSVGSREPKYFRNDWKLLNSRMLKRKYLGLKMKAELLDNEDHRSVSPRAFTNGLRYIFGSEKI